MIYNEITDEYYFWNWLKNSGSYQNNFSLEGSKAVFNYFEQYGEDLGEDISFDPIVWCCEFSEYDSLEEAWRELVAYDTDEPFNTEYALEHFQDNTTVIELDNGHIILGEF